LFEAFEDISNFPLSEVAVFVEFVLENGFAATNFGASWNFGLGNKGVDAHVF